MILPKFSQKLAGFRPDFCRFCRFLLPRQRLSKPLPRQVACIIYSKFYSRFSFAGFADLPAAKGRYFAGAGGKRIYRQNGMYSQEGFLNFVYSIIIAKIIVYKNSVCFKSWYN